MRVEARSCAAVLLGLLVRLNVLELLEVAGLPGRPMGLTLTLLSTLVSIALGLAVLLPGEAVLGVLGVCARCA